MFKVECLEFLRLLTAFRSLLDQVGEDTLNRSWPKGGHPSQGFLADARLMIDQKITRLTAAMADHDASAVDYVIRGMLGDVVHYYGEDLSWSPSWNSSRVFQHLHASCRRIIIEHRLGEHLDELQAEFMASGFVVEMRRGHIRYCHRNGRLVTVGVEALLRGHGGPDFVIAKSSVTHWETPHHHEAISDDERDSIVADLGAELSQRGITFAIQ